jgi:hypothetical protein
MASEHVNEPGGKAMNSWMPSRKWWGTLIAGLITIGGQAIGSGKWNTAEWAQVFTLASGLATAYFVPNQTQQTANQTLPAA